MTIPANTTFFDFDFKSTFQSSTLTTIDQHFQDFLAQTQPELIPAYTAYRQQSSDLTEAEQSELLISVAQVLDEFLANFFQITSESAVLRANLLVHNPIFLFKKDIVQKRAKRRLQKVDAMPAFSELTQTLFERLPMDDAANTDVELTIARWAQQLLCNPEAEADALELLTDWSAAVLGSLDPMAEPYRRWALFHQPKRLDYENLVSLESVDWQHQPAQAGRPEQARHRDGFALTDPRMDTRSVQAEVHYCIYCHDHDGDFCSKGFPVKKNQPELGFKKNPLGKTLTGCPLDEKISEMHRLRRDGFALGALAMVMRDNPMCPVTGHRICNDCMKACIYQKQDPVNIPQIETGTLTSVLALPWGVEIYDLLTRWNPLRQQQPWQKPYNGLKVFIAGMGPAGFTLAHHLLMEGFAVVGSEGLKIEPLASELLQQPIRDYGLLKESLDNRIMAGFGGVAEYGITVRWDKNFLKLIYLSLSRRPHFQVFGGIRFGGTVTVEDAWALGFDHVSIAVGAGLPQALPIPGSLAPGMRQANDFLMALQLTGAAKQSSLTNLQVRLPAIVIGGGLTGIDAATEVQAYYLVQVEKILSRYEQLSKAFGAARIRQHLDEESLGVLNDFLKHGQALRDERAKATAEGRDPDLRGLLRQWGGVSVAYRRRLQDSPAYRSNHEEVAKAFEEGIYYLEGLEPSKALLDRFGHIQAMRFQKRHQNAEGEWETGSETVDLEARCVLVATGARPNIAYEFEHRGSFERKGFQYIGHEWQEQTLTPVSMAGHSKTKDFGPFTSYHCDGNLVSFIGDTHGIFHGNVVNAVASGMRAYPKIVAALQSKKPETVAEYEYESFANAIAAAFTASVKKVVRHTPSIVELTIHAPMAAKKFSPGQFFRLQNYETHAPLVEGTRLQTEAMALTGADINPETGDISLMILEKGVSSRLCAMFKPGEPIALMGPTGVRTRIPETPETVLILGGRYCAAHIRAVGPALRQAGSRVIYIAGFQTAEDVYCQSALEAAADVIVWVTASGPAVLPQRPQDRSVTADFGDALLQYATGALHGTVPVALNTVDSVLVIGSSKLLRLFKSLRDTTLKPYLNANAKVTGSISSCMQCMMKGVCAQCLQWQVDPATGQRTKAVFACSWQDQPLDLVELDNLEERLEQNKLQEQLAMLWLDYLLANHAIERV